MKGFVTSLVVILAVIGAFIGIKSYTDIDQGEVGVVWTRRNGVQEELLTSGTNWISPLAKVKKYPISQQQLVLSNNPEDYQTANHPDWHVDAPANGGMVKLNMTINYNFIPERIVDLYTKFNGMAGEAIVDGMVQNSIIAYIKEVTPQFSVMDIYSNKRAEVSKAITDYLDTKIEAEYGINISSALIIDVQLDAALQEKIQAKEQAKQDAERAELDKQTAIAQGEADAARAEAAAEIVRINAQAEADVVKIDAEAKAEKTRINAEAQAEANKKIADSLTPELIESKKIERWNGSVPMVQGEAGATILDVGELTKGE